MYILIIICLKCVCCFISVNPVKLKLCLVWKFIPSLTTVKSHIAVTGLVCEHLVHTSSYTFQINLFKQLDISFCVSCFWHKSLHRISITVQCCGEWFFGSAIACLGVIFGRSPASGRLCRLKLLYCRGPSDALSPGYIRLQTQSTATIRLVLLSANIWGVTYNT